MIVLFSASAGCKTSYRPTISMIIRIVILVVKVKTVIMTLMPKVRNVRS